MDDKNFEPSVSGETASASLDSVAPVPSPAPPSGRNALRNIFFGPDGPRPGWRLLLFVLITAALIMLAHFGLHSAVRHLKNQVWLFLIAESEALGAVLIAALIMSRVEKRPFDAYGLPKRSAFGKSFWLGALWGVASLSILLLAIRGVGDFSFGGLAVHGARMLKFACFYGLLFLLVGLFEEFSFRGYMQFTLSQGMGFWPAAIVLSIVFGALHLGNTGEAGIGALSAGLIGFFFCLTLRRTGNLWFAVGLHAAWDWSESFLYSVPDSGLKVPGHLLNSSFHGSRWITGGSVGPEGSVLVFVLIGAIWLIFSLLYPQVRLATPNRTSPSQPAPVPGGAVQL